MVRTGWGEAMGSGGRRRISRRRFLEAGSLAVRSGGGRTICARCGFRSGTGGAEPLAEFGYGDVDLASDLHETQLRETHAVLMGLSDDSLLKPFRQMSGMAAPGEDLGGWYHYDPAGEFRQRAGAASRRDARSGNGFRRWRAAMRSPATRRRGKRCCG